MTKRQLARAVEPKEIPSTSAELKERPESPLPARRLRYEWIEEMTYDEMMDHLKYEALALAHQRMSKLSDYHGVPINCMD